ncbi:hypothetical protein [Alienimonas californiensis]|uniref:Uncharacterized protein n=1 Tax=Alienimonas californiensis TaxID=2527989 RepID=A0A517PEG1_9PLAN|nr:hypothetical protein [Alienimonas californiensis]QDT17741.1 hypothetical protein CA12_38730 [Alienimonas californiensis]
MGAATIRTAADFDWDHDVAPDGTPLAARLIDAPQWMPGLAPRSDEENLAPLVRRLAALCDRRGVPAFAPSARENGITEPLRQLADAAPHGPFAQLLAALPPDRTRRLNFPQWTVDDAPGFLSDPAAVGLLRTGWERTADAVALAWPDGQMSIELRAKGRRLFSGDWGVTVSIAGETLDLSAGWSCVCHHADDDGGFFELQWSGTCGAGPVRVERQAFLSREGGFATLSDAVRLTGPDAAPDATVEHAMTLPVAAGLSAGVAPETREARLFGGRKNWQRGRLFPLAVPQYPGDLEPGSIETTDATLTVRHRSLGGLVSPVAIDWNRWREEAPAEWRTLTVTENRRRLGAAHAGAHRLRIGRKHHLFLYRRTDDSPAPRAALGHHHSWETLIARFSRKGEVSPLLRV